MSTAKSIQTAVLNALRASATLAALLPAHAFIEGQKAIYDHVPQPDDAGNEAAFPFVVLGDSTEAEWDTDDSVGREITYTIHSFSVYRGHAELKDLMDAIKASLHYASLTVSGQSVVLCMQEFSESFLDPDGRTRHGVQRFRLLTEGD